MIRILLSSFCCPPTFIFTMAVIGDDVATNDAPIKVGFTWKVAGVGAKACCAIGDSTRAVHREVKLDVSHKRESRVE